MKILNLRLSIFEAVTLIAVEGLKQESKNRKTNCFWEVKLSGVVHKKNRSINWNGLQSLKFYIAVLINTQHQTGLLLFRFCLL